jgi:hypothetical protein
MILILCLCPYNVLNSAQAQNSFGQANGCVSQEDDILRTPVSDRAVDVPRARLDNRGYTELVISKLQSTSLTPATRRQTTKVPPPPTPLPPSQVKSTY